MAGESIWPRRKPLEAIAVGLLRVISPSRCVVRTSSRDALSGGCGAEHMAASPGSAPRLSLHRLPRGLPAPALLSEC